MKGLNRRTFSGVRRRALLFLSACGFFFSGEPGFAGTPPVTSGPLPTKGAVLTDNYSVHGTSAQFSVRF